MKILCVCGMGFGSSLMLKMTADKVIKKKGLKATVEATDIGTAGSTPVDLILTNNEFASQLKGGKSEVRAVVNVASEEEVEKAINDFLESQ
ncbi:PTS sugar transporter subunit IIB [Salisediminibacterium halotolerans]|uniref:PTS system, ascorbate-specific IIB component n=1 Tax=Salisediminibacterium halotolerans TaxID=517425 RepID=A0A1H9W9H3_9BACI|nr:MULTISPECIES: PTS sugar transporter subunit IIB [Salisediminibacterium]RLJ72300.1 PTS system IIB component (L-Asc family) [Actinophytocola xinjiangensis]RPE85514.1 PTS system IIB component (L-Asc family) [Salisediminibacterium halotolerans]TWG33469.1 PTS system IIB component (L-Asc family) [Salisediminibacterium halotolerans]SES30495.1 PTS system, ascorbate-specific IIB component [Salisediminibacterium haloalkalitolerans]GEL07920.1 PTS lactose transporter subunit IIB [Salisediminibacterium 